MKRIAIGMAVLGMCLSSVGQDKPAALARLRDGDETIPAGRIQRDNALVLADQAAAGPP